MLAVPRRPTLNQTPDFLTTHSESVARADFSVVDTAWSEHVQRITPLASGRSRRLSIKEAAATVARVGSGARGGGGGVTWCFSVRGVLWRLKWVRSLFGRVRYPVHLVLSPRLRLLAWPSVFLSVAREKNHTPSIAFRHFLQTLPELVTPSFRWCWMSSDVGWHIRNKLRPVR